MSQDISLNLTALMDILSNLLFFLLASYSAQAVEVESKANLKLPASSSQAKLIPSLTVQVTRQEIQVAGVPVTEMNNNEIPAAKLEEGGKIIPLYDRLLNVRSARTAGSVGAGAVDVPSADTILLLADKSTDSSIITKVLKTAGMAGFVNVRFGVIAQ